MALICSNCSSENPKGNRFCDSCGAKLKPTDEVAEKSPAKAQAPKSKGAKNDAADLEPGLARPMLDLKLDKTLMWFLIIVGFGAFLRLWELGLKPLHHDESIHAWYAFKLFKGDAYKYDPAYHGPFRYHMNALMFFIFGVSDFTTRILPAAFGIGLLIFLWHWRSLLGAKGAVITAALMAVSPSFVYNSRFIRDDITMAAGSLVMVWGIFKWFETRVDKYLYWLVAGWVVAFTSHEGTWIIMGIFGTFLVVRALWERYSNVVEDENQLGELGSHLALLQNPIKAGMGLAVVAALLFAGLGGTLAYSMREASLVYPLVSGLITLLITWFIFTQAQGSKVPAQLFAAALAPVFLAAGALGFVELRDSRRVWIKALAIFFIPFSLLYSTFFTNMDGWFIGAFDSIAYWLGEQKTGRADQPWQFYIYMLALYEAAVVLFAALGGFRFFIGSGKNKFFWMKLTAWIPVAIAIAILIDHPKEPRLVPFMAALGVVGAGMVAYSTFAPERGNFLKVFLLYWAMLSYIMFTIAGERMPWLTLHPLTPLTLLAGVYLGEFFDRDKPFAYEHWVGWGLLFLPVGFLMVMLPRQLFQALVHAPKELKSWMAAYKTGGRHGAFQPSGLENNIWTSGFFVGLSFFLFIVLLALTPMILERWPRLKNSTRGIFVGLFIVALGSLSHGTHNLIFQGNGADPREQHVYVQSTVELPALAQKLERMSVALTGGNYLKVAVEDLCSWPLSWYLRDLKNAQIGFGPPLTRDKVTDFPVVITGYENINQPDHDSRVAESFKAEYNPYPVRFRRWWAPDKGAVLKGNWRETGKKLWDLYMYREPWMPQGPIRNPQFQNFVYDKGSTIEGPYGSFDACVWVRKDVDRYFN